ncbi:enoyl-CoA hydratase/isomerase family protein [Gordonia sp. TBRC 11910]|uniref:3-hydroxyisobutyryl-CoA hydrolase n=1 Tax=Gordonia asplenii TaxID=2725283 RepID=A0A848KZU1_9ACTN|nr:enoyl-CoA hydratase/isomerase family protein [Gordonia asplenii]NMO03687.1 enoyl-CoA hydratase/isomerase family protein [Gordonia asplenii]
MVDSSTVETASVLASVTGPAATLILNRPASINALDHEMATVMEQHLRAWETDDSVSTVIIAGAGERGLCAGGDIVAIHADAKALSERGDAAPATDREAAACGSAIFWADEYRLNDYIASYPKPYVALMDGIVMGGGVGISAHGNTRIVTDRTRLAMPEVGIGFVPDVGGTFLLARVPDELGTYLALTTSALSGADAVALGLADHYIPSDALDDFRAALAVSSVDDAVAAHAQTPPASTLLAQAEWIREAFAHDTVGEIVAACRAVGSAEAAKTADKIESKSPTALAVALRSLRAAKDDATLADSLRTEYRVALRALLHPDLAEGIRAQVIDKDRTPSWTPATIDAVEAATVDAFFAPLPADLELRI